MKQIRKTLVCTAILLAIALTGCAKDGNNSATSEQTDTAAMEQDHTPVVPTNGASTATPMESLGEGILAQGSCGEQLTWTLDENGLLTISGSGAMIDYTDPMYIPWRANDDQIRSVRILEGVTRIGDKAFWGCSSLTSVAIQDSVSSIGKEAFFYCSNLTSVTIPNSVTRIETSAFEHCTSLAQVTIPASVTEIGVMAFCECDALTAFLVAPDNANYSSLDGVLFNKAQTELIRYPVGKPDSSYVIPDGVTNIDGAFTSCANLVSVTFPASLTNVGDYAFSCCYHLADVQISETVTNIGESAFKYCTHLERLTIPSTVTSIGNGAFSACRSLPSIDVASDNQNYCSLDGVLFNKAQTELIQYPAGKTGASYSIPDGVTRLCDYSFYDCESLTNVTIPDGLTSIGRVVFSGNEHLSVTIPASVTDIDELAFLNESLVIHAPAGSYAETYAKENNIPFQAQ